MFLVDAAPPSFKHTVGVEECVAFERGQLFYVAGCDRRTGTLTLEWTCAPDVAVVYAVERGLRALTESGRV